MEKEKSKKTPRIILIAAIIVIAALAVGAYYYVQNPGVLAKVTSTGTKTVSDGSVHAEETTTADEQKAAYREITALDDFGGEKWDEGVIKYNGKLYRYNSGLKNYLFMGIDNENTVQPAEDGISGGQSDAMFLLCLDEAARDVKIIAINRNTMVPVDVYDREGNFLVQMDLQICLQHGYGDGMKLSCLRSVEAVDRLFKDVPISGYLTLNMGGMAAVNDAVGGITLTPLETVIQGDVIIPQGSEITLDGKQAYTYLRTRDINKEGTSDDRLKRQQQYVTAFIQKILSNPSLANKVYEAGKDYMVASIDLVKLINSSKDMRFDENSLYSIPGETGFKDGFETYDIDETAMIELILDVFYKEAGE